MTALIIESTTVDRDFSSPQGRILALDFGKRRIGMAVSDPLRLIAGSLETLQRTTTREDIERIAAIAREREITLFLMGHPLNMNGTEGPQAERAREFAARLERHCRIPVELWDERLTSVAAEEMLRERGSRPDRRTGTVDRLAAAILLQSYLDHQPPGPESEPPWPAAE